MKLLTSWTWKLSSCGPSSSLALFLPVLISICFCFSHHLFSLLRFPLCPRLSRGRNQAPDFLYPIPFQPPTLPLIGQESTVWFRGPIAQQMLMWATVTRRVWNFCLVVKELGPGHSKYAPRGTHTTTCSQVHTCGVSKDISERLCKLMDCNRTCQGQT